MRGFLRFRACPACVPGLLWATAVLFSACGGEGRLEPPPAPDPDAPLCEETWLNPGDMIDPVQIHCAMERGGFAPAEPPVPAVLRVVDWNIERGLRIDEMIDAFLEDPALREADVLLVQEADRNCTRTDYRNVTRELAQALGMNYVYGVEFVELFQDRGECGSGSFRSGSPRPT